MKVVCVGCADVISIDTKSERTKCPICTTEICNDVYRKISTYSRYAIRYGHHYKDYYSDPTTDINGRIIKPCLEEPTVLETFIAQAVIGGILGNAAWSAIVSIIKKLVDEHATPKDIERVRKRIEPTFGEEQVSVEKLIEEGLVRDILIFYREDGNFSPEVEEEIVADSMMIPEIQQKQLPRLDRILSITTTKTNLTRKERRIIDREREKITGTAIKVIKNSKPNTLGCNTIWGRGNKKS
ncbi:hypothetical protein H2C68_07460 [Vibrio alginolyticus]|uniref:hypothetical protein n=1 Tax=Vibrio alginolyticus TaxID=663 RepID=UPI00211A0B93|nr:hypothetical protein [Vibrio alginolyticus]MCQ9036819.1 hypothetical protein [Vibrio alginolyticus]